MGVVIRLLFALFWLFVAGGLVALNLGTQLRGPWREQSGLLVGLALLFSLLNFSYWWWSRREARKRRDFEAELTALRERRRLPSEPEA